MTSNNQLPLLVIDKSYAQAVKANVLAEIALSFMIVEPTAFYAEVFDTMPSSQQSTLTGFPEFRRVDIAKFLRREREAGQPVTCTRRLIHCPIRGFGTSASVIPSAKLAVGQVVSKLPSCGCTIDGAGESRKPRPSASRS